MKTATIRGVPSSVQRDGWWMDGIERGKGQGDRRDLPRDMRGPMLLMALLALADAMVWQVMPGLSLALFALCLVGAACLMAQSLSPQRAMAAGGTVLIAVAPAVEIVQPLSVLLMGLGLLVALCLVAGVKPPDLWRAVRRYPFVAALFVAHDTRRLTQSLRQSGPPEIDLRALALGWAVPVILGLIFLTLLVGANPLLDQSLSRFFEINVTLPDTGRMTFWGLMALVISAGLVAGRMTGPLTARKPARHMVHRPGLINAASVTRSLVLFNLLFAVQTIMDLSFLYGATALPEGMSYATYAHRGAYPLLVTALLAGAFAVLARPFTDDRPALRALLLLWLAQTLALVLASATRLEVYVDVYGLTRLRVAAAIWMALVGLGLCLVIWQVVKRRDTLWMLARATLLGLGTLYASAFLNFDGLIAHYNLTRPVKLDRIYLCSLSEAVLLPLQRELGHDPRIFCNQSFYYLPEVFVPQDWREWGFRNWRLRTSLAALEEEPTL